MAKPASFLSEFSEELQEGPTLGARRGSSHLKILIRRGPGWLRSLPKGRQS